MLVNLLRFGLVLSLHLVKNLKFLRGEVARGHKEKKKSINEDMVRIENEIDELGGEVDGDIFSKERKEYLLNLELQGLRFY